MFWWCWLIVALAAAAVLAVAAAAAAGLINGDENGNFDPDGNITYTDGAKILLQALGYEPLADSMGGYPSGYYFTAN